jgi:predicted nucleic acid-binding protein
MYLLDTDVLIDIQRGHEPAISWFSSLTEVPSVPVFVVMELVQDS